MLFGEEVNANWSLVGCSSECQMLLLAIMRGVITFQLLPERSVGFGTGPPFTHFSHFFLRHSGVFMEISFCGSCNRNDHVSGNGRVHGMFCKPICPAAGLELRFALQALVDVYLWRNRIHLHERHAPPAGSQYATFCLPFVAA